MHMKAFGRIVPNQWNYQIWLERGSWRHLRPWRTQLFLMSQLPLVYSTSKLLCISVTDQTVLYSSCKSHISQCSHYGSALRIFSSWNRGWREGPGWDIWFSWQREWAQCWWKSRIPLKGIAQTWLLLHFVGILQGQAQSHRKGYANLHSEWACQQLQTAVNYTPPSLYRWRKGGQKMVVVHPYRIYLGQQSSPGGTG